MTTLQMPGDRQHRKRGDQMLDRVPAPQPPANAKTRQSLRPDGTGAR
jgi:hypothetical protein